jgi:hypothetical protein
MVKASARSKSNGNDDGTLIEGASILHGEINGEGISEI